jgi:hypothetical protein
MNISYDTFNVMPCDAIVSRTVVELLNDGDEEEEESQTERSPSLISALFLFS